MLKLLVEHGADINEVCLDVPWSGPLAKLAMSFTPSDKKERHQTIEKLLKLGADPNVLHAQDMTAIMCAAKLGSRQGYKAAVGNCEILIDHGADVNLVNTAGETALMLAAAAGNQELVEMFIDAGADVNRMNTLNKSALTYADRATVNKSTIVKMLKKAGAQKGSASANATSVHVNQQSSVLSKAPDELYGTWKGYMTGNKVMMATFVMNKNDTYTYSANTTVNWTVVSTVQHKGGFVASADTYILKPEGQPSVTYSYKIMNGQLIVNDGAPLDKIK